MVSGRGRASWFGLGLGGVGVVVTVWLVLVGLIGSASRPGGVADSNGGSGGAGVRAVVVGGACCGLRFARGAGGDVDARRFVRGCSTDSLGCCMRCCRAAHSFPCGGDGVGPWWSLGRCRVWVKSLWFGDGGSWSSDGGVFWVRVIGVEGNGDSVRCVNRQR